MFLYRHILKESFKITWRNKYLWFFGLFAALLGNGGEYEVLVRGLLGDTGEAFFPSIRRFASTGIFSPATLTNIHKLASEEPLTLFMAIFMGAVLLALLCFLVWLTIISQIALVNNTALLKSGKKNNFQDGVIAGMKHFLPVFGLNVILKIIIACAFTLLGFSLILNPGRWGYMIYGLLFIFFIPLAIAFSFIVKYSIAFVVIKGRKLAEAVRSGYRLFIANWLLSLEMALLLYLINFTVGLTLLILYLILAIPLFFLAAFFQQIGAFFALWTIVILAAVLFFASIVLVGMGLATFQISSWTLLFVELVNRGGRSKLARIMSKLQ